MSFWYWHDSLLFYVLVGKLYLSLRAFLIMYSILTMALKFRDCQGTLLLEEAAKGIKATGDFNDLKEEAQRAKKNMMTIKKKANQQLVTIQKHKNKVMNQVREARKKVDNILDEIERKTMADLERNFANETTTTQGDIKMYDDITNGLNDATDLFVGKQKCVGEKGIFVGVKRAHVLVQDSDRIINFVKHNFTYEPPRFSTDVRISNWIRSVGVLGTFSFRTKAYVAEYLNKYHVKLPVADEKVCDIFGCKFLDNDHVVITDWDNQNVKKLDGDFQVIDSVEVDGNPNHICILNPMMIAVTMPNQKYVQLIELTPRMVLSQKIVTEDTCRGIGCHGDLMYVTCGGFKGESDGRILVYNLSGDLTRSFERNNSGQKVFVCPIAIAMNSDGTMMTVADGQRGVITMTTQNDVVSVVADKDCVWPCGICIDKKDNAMVCCGRSSSVIQIACLNKVGTILTQANGIKEPRALCYDSNNMRLLVTQKKSNEVMLFQLKHPDMKFVLTETKDKLENANGALDEKKTNEISVKDQKYRNKGTPRAVKPNPSNIVDMEEKVKEIKSPVKENEEKSKSTEIGALETLKVNVKNQKDDKFVFKIVKGDNNDKLVKVVEKRHEIVKETQDEESPYNGKLDVVIEEAKDTKAEIQVNSSKPAVTSNQTTDTHKEASASVPKKQAITKQAQVVISKKQETNKQGTGTTPRPMSRQNVSTPASTGKFGNTNVSTPVSKPNSATTKAKSS